MHPTSHDYHLSQIERLAAAFATISTQKQRSTETPTMYVAAGEPIFSGHEPESKTFMVTSGEVLIVRNGRPVDLLEAGELLDLSIWPGAFALALNNCTLVAHVAPVLSL